MSKTTFTYEYTRNGQTVYPAGVAVDTTDETRALIESGVAGEITEDAPEEEQPAA